MVREIDTSKPLSDDDIAYLKTRYPTQYIARLQAVAEGNQFSSSGGTNATEPSAAPNGGQPTGEGTGTEPKQMKEGDNPGDFTVDEVNAYLKTLDAESDEYKRVVAAEKADKNRSGIVGS